MYEAISNVKHRGIRTRAKITLNFFIYDLFYIIENRIFRIKIPSDYQCGNNSIVIPNIIV